MAVDETEHWLATGDVEGTVKVWDISTYCTTESGPVAQSPPRESH